MNLSSLLPLFSDSVHKFLEPVYDFFSPTWGKFSYIHFIYIGASVSIFTFETYLNYRQFKRCSKPYDAKKLKNLVNEEEYQKAVAYEKDSIKYAIFRNTIAIVLTTFSFYIHWGPKTWNYFSKLLPNSSEYSVSIAYFLLYDTVESILSIPLSLYRDFVIEARHGFNKKTIKLFIKDFAIGLFLRYLFTPPLTGLYIYLARNRLDSPFHLFAFVIVIQLMGLIIYPKYIMPIYNKFEPLDNEELKQSINKLAEEQNFPVGKIYQSNNSIRSSHSNAFFLSSIFDKMIVFYDTILTQENEKILAVLAHEIGHWKHSHLLKGFCLSNCYIFGLSYLYKMVVPNNSLLISFGYPENNTSLINLTLFFTLCFPINFVENIIAVLVMRRFEYQADRYATVNCNLGSQLAQSLSSLSHQNKSHPDPDPLYVYFRYSHPSTLERIEYINSLESETKKKSE